jgi:hypothetical protein
MPCCLGCLVAFAGAAAPRVLFFVLWVFYDYVDRAYDTFVWPFLAILFMPYTGLAYAFSINTYGEVRSWGLVLLVLGVIMDISAHAAGAASRRTREQ